MIDANNKIFLIDIDSISFKIKESCVHTKWYSPCKLLILVILIMKDK